MTKCFQGLAEEIYCIEADYVRPGLACFYLIGDGEEYALIETGTSHSLANLLITLETLAIDVLQVRYVVPTHVHLDHAGAAGLFMRTFPEATLLVHPRGERHLIDPSRLIDSAVQVYGAPTFEKLYGEILPVAAERIRVLEDGDSFSIGQRVLCARHTRGHAEHHFCLWDERTRGWFTGDTFGISYDFLRFESGSFVLPATTPTQFDPSAYSDSVAMLGSDAPACMYLTHYSRLPFEDAQVELLQNQLLQYDQLGKKIGGDQVELRSAIAGCTREYLLTFVNGAEADAVVERLAMDIALNAQGIFFRAQQSASLER